MQYWLLLAIKALIWCVDLVTDLLFGWTYTGGRREEVELSKQYENSAHVVSINLRGWNSAFNVLHLGNFVYKHEKYVHPRYILRKKNVTLMAVNKDYSMFCETEPTVDIYDIKKFPFTYMAQATAAQKLVILPTWSFHRLAEDAGNPKVSVAMVQMTARCGSTLLSQIMSRVPKVRSMSEPFATISIHHAFKTGQISQEENKRLLVSAIRLHCKVETGAEVDRIFMKMSISNAPQFEIVAKAFPEILMILNTRHPLPSFKSFKKLFGLFDNTLNMRLGIAWRQEMFFLCASFPYSPRYLGFEARISPWYQNISTEEACIMMYVAVMSNYFEHKDLYGYTVLYENLVADPRVEILKLFRTLGLSEDYVELGLKAMEGHSQEKVFGPLEAARKKDQEKHGEILSKHLVMMDDWLADVDLPIRHDTTVEEFKHIFDQAKLCKS